jgi:hypothetical protein
MERPTGKGPVGAGRVRLARCSSQRANSKAARQRGADRTRMRRVLRIMFLTEKLFEV